jgi:hypothetical protein
MAKYRKKPIVIDAEQWTSSKYIKGVIPDPVGNPMTPEKYCIKTLEGNHIVSEGDWIITGVKGEMYPCKPDIFEMTYERVD